MSRIRLSIALAFMAALLSAPLAQVSAANKCGMFGASSSKAKNCQGCCAQMKCCADSKQGNNPAQNSGGRCDPGLAAAMAPKAVTFLFTPAAAVVRDWTGTDSPSRPFFASLSRLCIRLI